MPRKFTNLKNQFIAKNNRMNILYFSGLMDREEMIYLAFGFIDNHHPPTVFLWGVGDYQYDYHCRILLTNSQNIFFHAFFILNLIFIIFI